MCILCIESEMNNNNNNNSNSTSDGVENIMVGREMVVSAHQKSHVFQRSIHSVMLLRS